MLTVLISAHNEDLVAVKTLKSVKRSLQKLDNAGISYEVICTIDSPTPETKALFDNQKIIIAKNIFINKGDLSANRMVGINAAHGKYIAIIDADDLCSENWFIDGLNLCKKIPNVVVHTENSISFGAANILWKKTNSKSISTEAIYNIQGNRWDSAVVAPAQLMQKYGYLPNMDGFGSEDWDFNMRTLNDGVKHMVAPKTILFVRRRENGSEMDKQRLQKRIVRPGEMSSLSKFRSIRQDRFFLETTKDRLSNKIEVVIKAPLRPILYNSPLIKIIKIFGSKSQFLKNIRQKQINNYFPKWIMNEWRNIHSIEKELFPSREVLRSMQYYDAEQSTFGWVYKQIANVTRYDHYDYVLFVPYLNRGGADLVAIKYANSIAKQSPDKKICVISTEDRDSEWCNKLDETIDFVPFGQITRGINLCAKLDILARFFTNISPNCLHIINSALAYGFVKTYNQYIKSNGVNVIVCAFCEDILSDGHVMGYIHTLLPGIYKYTNKILTDNQTVINTLCDEYGYDPGRFKCHYIAIEKNIIYKSDYAKKSKLLWASRISYQKQPRLLREISKKLATRLPGVSIDVYGSFADNIDKSIFFGLSKLHYKGPFSGGISSLPLNEYDAFLYTSLYDGIPNVLLEAANSKMPIITSNVGGINELCTNKVNSFVVDDVKKADSYVEAIYTLYNTETKDIEHMVDSIHNMVSERHSKKHFDLDVKNDIIPFC